MMNTRAKTRTFDLPTLFSWFIIYSYIGWVYETIYCSIHLGRYVDRGFLYGPLCPIYGSCIVIVILLFSERCKTIPSLFLSCALFASAQEYITSFLMEYAFGRRWWDYSHRLFNINGRVCLEAAVVFGTCGVLVIRFLHPNIVRYMNENFQQGTLRKLNKIVLVIFILDLIASTQMSL